MRLFVLLLAASAASASIIDGVLKKPVKSGESSRPSAALLRGPLRLGEGSFMVEFAQQYASSDSKDRKTLLREKTAEYRARSKEDFPVYAFSLDRDRWRVAVGARPYLVRIVLDKQVLELVGTGLIYSETFSPEELLYLARGAKSAGVGEADSSALKPLGELLEKQYWKAEVLAAPLKDRLWDFVLVGLSRRAR